MLKRHQQGIAKESHEHVRLDAFFQLMKKGADCQFTLERSKYGFHFRQLDVLLPELGRRVGCQIGT